MSFIIHKKIFFDILQKAYPIVPSESSLPILLNFKLILQPGCLIITSTDLDHSIRLKTPIKGNSEFEITVNAKKIFEVVKELYDDDLTIDCDETVLIIESGGSFLCKISGSDTKDFPAFPEIESFSTVDISVDKLKDMIVKSSFAVSKDDVRDDVYACLRGVLWEVESNRTGMIATDGHRLGYSFYTGEFSVDNKILGIISPKSLLHLVRILDTVDTDASIRVSFGEKYILFSNDTLELCSRLIDGPYPDYERAVPKDNTKSVTVDKNTIIDAVRRVSVLSNQETHLVKFIFRNEELEIIVLNRDIGGEARQIIPINYEGEEHIIGFNAVYFSEILNIIKTKTIRLEMNTKISACLIYPIYENEDDKKSDDLFLIMPLRIYSET